MFIKNQQHKQAIGHLSTTQTDNNLTNLIYQNNNMINIALDFFTS